MSAIKNAYMEHGFEAVEGDYACEGCEAHDAALIMFQHANGRYYCGECVTQVCNGTRTVEDPRDKRSLEQIAPLLCSPGAVHAINKNPAVTRNGRIMDAEHLRQRCIMWLVHNDPNGEYTDFDCLASECPYLTLERGIELIEKQVSEGEPEPVTFNWHPGNIRDNLGTVIRGDGVRIRLSISGMGEYVLRSSNQHALTTRDATLACYWLNTAEARPERIAS